jgi:solute carrier family 25 phosphate transporter 23/24/25/41
MSALSRLVCGGIAGITSVTVTYPLDIVRTRLSIQSASFADLGPREQSQKLPGMWTTMVTIYKNEGGMIALYRGIAPTVAGVAPYVSEGTFILSDLSALRMLLTCDFQGWSEFHDI